MSGVEPNFLFQAIAVLMGGLVIWDRIQSIQRRGEVQKREVRYESVFATKEELEAVADEMKRLESKLETAFAGLRAEMREDKSELLKAGETRVVAVHNRMNDILSAVSELRGEVHATRRTDK